MIFPAPLAETAAQLRNGSRNLTTYINELCDRVDQVDTSVQALLPEPGRRERLRVEAAALAARFPAADNRPLLYGALVAIKDIFHVDGFVTRAGSNVSPELFAGREAAVVTLLRQAGALILGKAVTLSLIHI